MAKLASSVSRLELPRRGRMLWAAFFETRDVQLRAQEGLLRAIASGDGATVCRAFDQWDITTARTQAILADFSAYNVKRLDRTVNELESRRARSLAALFALLAAAAGVALPYSLFVSRRVTRPLLAMGAVAERVAREREALAVEGAERADEIGALARAFNAMTEDLVRTNAQLAGALRVRDEFLSIASHELKTPVTSLRLQLDGIARRMRAEGEAVPPWIGVAQRQVRRIEALIGQLLDVTRIREGRLALEIGDVDLASVGRDAAERLSPELERAGNTLELDLAPGVVGRWDAGRLDQVVTNLLTNAAKYAPGTAVSVRVRAGPGSALLEVEDAGAGVPEALRPRVFEAFERGTTPRAVSGLGLGLFIVRQIVEAHGGTVQLEQAPSGGARFVIEIPCAEPAARSAAGEA
jgi:signal transduction histidine kinase